MSEGQPLFPEPLHVGRPNIGDREAFLSRVGSMLDRRWFTNNGPLVQQFEHSVADFIGVKHCVAMCNATVALEIASQALGLSGEVIVPAFTFVATAHALQWQGITPVFADIDPGTHNIDPNSVERLITPRTSGIVGVHVWGRACDDAALAHLAKKHGLKLMYDAAHAFGCSSHNGRLIGGLGDCEVFSFHATKFLNSFEGGAVVTNNDALAEKMRLMRNFGFLDFDRVVHLGVNGKMTEICAAMGLTSLESVADLIAINRRNYLAYQSNLRGTPGIALIDYPPTEANNYQYVVVQVDPALCPVGRDELVRHLHANNILARKYFWPGCHRMEPYITLQPNAWRHLPVTERVAQGVMVLPTGQSVGLDDIAAICGLIKTMVAHAAAR
ncbi:aminotransferase class I/II-fold pyridoxal phosphate-dependent enzyme [Horticoccus luteus]|uniref:Aminotransferase class I/II-fold pyridoxal phosphate-dependent enzyme n=1 Tax=Horticoccus luteus TaxID=2862869 RepID=A0A8F9TVB5_9BACT|nr:DegT/DnrJ/EryC1/StrS family aminotransferase [Horticoccus luteus]QYM79786.1 aminotransferase class I/II-fold pyridoxal phosphate-dependent enzyme [Horticoccus luteus]